MNIRFLVVVFTFFSIPLLAQPPAVIQSLDSLAAVYAQASPAQEQDSLFAKDVNLLAMGYYEYGLFEPAEKLYVRAVELCEAIGDENDIYSSCLSNLAGLYSQTGRYEQALELFQKSLEMKAKLFGEESKEYAINLGGMASVYWELGDLDAVEPLVVRAEQILGRVAGKMDPIYGEAINNLAGFYYSVGRIAEAETFFLESKEIIIATYGKQHMKYAQLVNNLGGVYLNMNRLPEAEANYKEAGALIAELLGPTHPYYSYTAQSLAIVYNNTGRFELSEQLLKEVLSIKEASFGKEHVEYAMSLSVLGDLYIEMQDYERAKKIHHQALEINSKVYDAKASGYIKSLNDLARVYAELEDHKTARYYIQEALIANCKEDRVDSLVIADDLKSLGEANFYHNSHLLLSFRMIYELALMDYRKSSDKKYLKQAYNGQYVALRNNERTKNSFLGEEDKIRTLVNTNAIVKDAIDLSIQLTEGDDQDYTQQAFIYAEQSKSVLLADAIKGNRAKSMSDLPDSVAIQEQQLQEQKSQLLRQEVEAVGPEEKKMVHAQLNALNVTIEAFLNALKEKYPKYHHLKYENITASAQDVQALLDDKSMLLEYFVADTVSYLFAITKQNVALHKIELDKGQLIADVGTLRKTLSDYKFILNNKERSKTEFVEKASLFYDLLLKPVLPQTGIEHLIIVTDDVLGHLPFEVFLKEPSLGQNLNYIELPYLVKDYNISYNYSATLWKENLSQKPKNNGQMMAFGASYPALDSLELGQLRSFQWSRIRRNLSPLPGTTEEVKKLSELFSGNYQEGAAAHEANFKASASDYGVIHLAMHGILHPREPMLSSLAFTENMNATEDNFLQAYEIAHLDLNASMVVLSACETGFGKYQEGEGIISLARSFMYAGVPSLVVSLWQVNDISTAFIMELFYGKIAEGLPKDVALRQAKLTYLEMANEMAGHPAYWSAFIQLGDSRPIQLKAKNGNWPWYVGGAVLFLICLIAFKRRIQ